MIILELDERVARRNVSEGKAARDRNCVRLRREEACKVRLVTWGPEVREERIRRRFALQKKFRSNVKKCTPFMVSKLFSMLFPLVMLAPLLTPCERKSSKGCETYVCSMHNDVKEVSESSTEKRANAIGSFEKSRRSSQQNLRVKELIFRMRRKEEI